MMHHKAVQKRKSSIFYHTKKLSIQNTRKPQTTKPNLPKIIQPTKLPLCPLDQQFKTAQQREGEKFRKALAKLFAAFPLRFPASFRGHQQFPC
jgi:hypothetical protein